MGVCQGSKLQNWKQFTTERNEPLDCRMVYVKDLNYKTESNSQPDLLNANSEIGVCQGSKLQNWKQFTTYWNYLDLILLVYVKDLNYKTESNSQP